MDPIDRRFRGYWPEEQDPFADPAHQPGPSRPRVQHQRTRSIAESLHQAERTLTPPPPGPRSNYVTSHTQTLEAVDRSTRASPGESTWTVPRITSPAQLPLIRQFQTQHGPQRDSLEITAAPQDPIVAIARAVTVPKPSSGATSISVPALIANEKTAVELADAVDPKIIKRGKRKVWFQKQLLIFFVFSANFILIFGSWYWPRYYYLYLPFISLPLILNCIMIFMIIIYSLKNLIWKPTKIVPYTPESMVLLMPCYNESFEECTRSLDSLTSQVNIDQHKKAIMIVCDGKVRGPGMEKTTAQYLAEDILAGPQTQRFMIRAAYLAWDGQTMDVECLKGVYKGVPFFCINKQQNQGKRDSLIVSRSFVYNFNKRTESPKVVFAPPFFEAMASWLQNDAGFEQVDVLIGMDADTVFETDCISHLITESHYPQTVGVCGYVAVDFQHGKWNLWSIYQSAEYTIAQALRRLHQSVVTHKVSCLPGCCQLLKVCEETCGDPVLIDLFGYHPKPLDGVIRRIRATASEDRNHVCLMLMESPKAQTRQALRARAYTDVPHSLKVFLSQRRRWTLGATSNDLMLFTRAPWRTFNLWERIIAFSNVLTWVLNPFVIASLGCMIYAFLHQPWYIIVAFAAIMIIPLVYYITMVFWMPRGFLERAQFLLGLTIFAIAGPFINICVTLYALKNMDNFGWGKTRQVIAETGEAEETNADEEQRRTQVALRHNEKVIGNQVPDEENQLAHVRVANPFTAPVIVAPRSAAEPPQPEQEPEQEPEQQPEEPEIAPSQPLRRRNAVHSFHTPQINAARETPGSIPTPTRSSSNRSSSSRSRPSMGTMPQEPLTPQAAEPYYKLPNGVDKSVIPTRSASLQRISIQSDGNSPDGPPASMMSKSTGNFESGMLETPCSGLRTSEYAEVYDHLSMPLL